MGALTEDRPKPMIEVHGKPILWYSFWTLYNHGFRHFILPIGYLGQEIEAYIAELTEELDCRIECVDTGETTPINLRIQMIRHLIPEGANFFLLNSDTIFDFDVEAMLEIHRAQNALVTLSSVEVVSTWGLITIDDDRVVGFDRQRKVRHLVSDDLPGKYGLVNSGLAWLNKAALNLVDLETCGDFETAIFQRAIDLGRAAHYEIHGDWFPVDTPKDLHVLNLMEEDRHRAGEIAKEVRDRLNDLAPHPESIS